MEKSLKLKIIAIITILMLVMPITVMATDINTNVVQLGEQQYASFEDALGQVTSENNEITLLKDVALSATVKLTKDLTINLNGHKITAPERVFEVQGCEFTVTGQGSIEETAPNYSPIVVKGSNNVEDTNYTVVNIGKDVTLKGWAGLFITPYASGVNTAYGVVVNVDGTLNSIRDTSGAAGHGLYINGTIQHVDNAPVFNLSETAKVTSLGDGIYAAGYATWNINGASIEGVQMGLGIKSGNVNLNNASVTATGEDSTPTEGFSNGINASGAAIQLESNKSYAGKINLKIDGGILTSKNSVVLYEYLDSKTTVTNVDKVEVNDAKFVAGADKRAVMVSSEFNGKIGKFLTSGTYSSDVTEFVKEGYISKKVGETYTVGKENAIVLPTNVTEGTIIASVEKAVKGETVKLTATAKEGYELKSITVKDSLGNTVALTNNEFVMPNSAVEVSVVFGKLVQEVETPTIDPTEEVKDVTVGVSNQEAANTILLGSLNENKDFEELLKTTNLKVEVQVVDIEVEEDVQKEIDEIIKESGLDMEIAKFFDISVLVKDSNTQEEQGKLSELNEELEFTIALPEDLQDVKEGYTRIYFIVREHNGEYDNLETTLSTDGKFLKFKSGKFSTYALAYVDVQNEDNSGSTGNENTENNNPGNSEGTDETNKNDNNQSNNETPKTGDIVVELFASLAIISIAGIIIFAVNNKRNKK